MPFVLDRSNGTPQQYTAVRSRSTESTRRSGGDDAAQRAGLGKIVGRAHSPVRFEWSIVCHGYLIAFVSSSWNHTGHLATVLSVFQRLSPSIPLSPTLHPSVNFISCHTVFYKLHSHS